MSIRIVRRAAAFLPLLILSCAVLMAGGPKTVAATEWTAAFCRAAGITDLVVLAPANLLHPPEYELRPSDIPILMDADLIVFSGYEAMMERIYPVVSGTGAQLLRIETSYDPVVIKKSLGLIAKAAGTTPTSLAKIQQTWEEARRLISEAGLVGAVVIAHQFQVPFAEEIGLDVQGVFGPAPPGPRLIADSASIPAEFVLDNGHGPIAGPIAEVLKDAVSVELINFPGRNGTRELEEVILHNTTALIEAVK